MADAFTGCREEELPQQLKKQYPEYHSAIKGMPLTKVFSKTMLDLETSCKKFPCLTVKDKERVVNHRSIEQAFTAFIAAVKDQQLPLDFEFWRSMGAGIAKIFSSVGHPIGLLARNLQAMKALNLPNSMCIETDITSPTSLEGIVPVVSIDNPIINNVK